MQEVNEITDVSQRLLAGIQNRSAKVAIIGLGYVGLPLAVGFAGSGFSVKGFDVSRTTVDGINAGTSHIPDVGNETLALLVQSGTLSATTDMTQLGDADIISICVPTPLSKTRDPDMAYVSSATDEVAKSLRRGQLIVLESTTYPGTTREVILPRLEASGLEAGKDFFLAFSPERIDPGNQDYGIGNTPKVVGGLDDVSTELASAFYNQAIATVVPVSSPEAAEMSKLLENTFRAVNIGLANEVALMCDRLGINVWEVIDAAATKPYGYMPFYPGPGIGGHCIPLDPHYLAWKMKTLDYRARFIELASEVNAGMPFHVLDKIVDGLNGHEKSVKSSSVLIVGVAYKRDVDDVRESPALDIIGLLTESGANVSYHDPYVSSLRIGDEVLESSALTSASVEEADCVVIVTNHKVLDTSMIARHAKLVVDTRRALESESNIEAQVLSI